MDSGGRTGAVTFLFTDIEGSARLWETEPARIGGALARHDRLSRAVVEAHGGDVVKMTGDGLHAVFGDPAAAVAAVVELQRGVAAIASECGIPLKLRCGLHAGLSEARDGDFFGSAVNRTARIMSAAHGGQVLLSQAVVELGKGRFRDDTSLLHLGRMRLRDLAAPEDVWQLLHSDLPRTFPPLRSLDAAPNNLPQQLTSFIGRENEIADVGQLLRAARLVTLTGSGGAGKTRLSLQVAARCIDDFADGVWLVELAPLTDARLVPQTVATVLGIKEQAGEALADTLTRELKHKALLLLLDNCEHLIAAAAQLCQSLLAACAQVRILATSREALCAPGESAYRVPSLSTPDPKLGASVETLARYAAVQLFIDRAVAVKSSFQVDDANAPAIISICHRLDGIPLAIELAAARVRSMSLNEVNGRLDQRFGLLTRGVRTALPRQQTLRALIDWSYDLLTAAEKALLCRTSVFSGGWTLEAIEQVCGGEGINDGEVLDGLTSLVDKSLVIAEERDGVARYQLLETVRQYARDRLREHNEEVRWQSRHLAYFRTLAEAAEPQLLGADQQAWLERLETEHDNLRSALASSASAGGDHAGGLRLAGAVFRFWWRHGHVSEARGWLSGLLASAPRGTASAPRAKALNAAAALALVQGDYPSSRALGQQSLAICRELADHRGIAAVMNTLGQVALVERDFEAARAMHEESLAIRRELGDRWGISASLANLGAVAQGQGDFGSARMLTEESLTIGRELGDRWGIALSLHNLGWLALHQGDPAAARALHGESLVIWRELGDRWGISSSLAQLGDVAHSQGDYPAARVMHAESLRIRREMGDRLGTASSLEGLAAASALERPRRAARIWGAAERLREEIGNPLPPADRVAHEHQVAAGRAIFGDDAAFDRAWQDGRASTLEETIEYALAGT
jgi:predicted ATPase/class 3 adenylate cyclase